MKLLLRIPRHRPTPWAPAVYDARYGVALGLLYVVGCAVVALLLALGELEATASRGDALVRTVPYWRSE